MVALLGIAYQGVYAVAQLVSLGLIARHFSLEEYGLWLTVIAVTTWIPVAAWGQNAVVLTAVGSQAGVDDAAARRSFQSSLAIVAGSSGLLAVLLLLGGHWLPWAALLSAQAAEARVSVAAVAWAACLVSLAALPLVQMGYSVYANQRGDLTHLAMTAGSLLLLLATAGAVHLGWPLWAVGALSLAGPVLGGCLLLLRCAGSTLLPLQGGSWQWRELPVVAAWKAGLQFVVVDGLSLLVVRTSEVLVAHLHGIAAVPAFASVGRLTVLSLALYQAVLFPIWPAISRAHATGQRQEVRHLMRRNLAMVLLMWAVLAAGIVLGGQRFTESWLGRADMAPVPLLWAAAAQALGLALMSWLTVMLSALGWRSVLIKALASIATGYLALAVVLGQMLGPLGVAVAQALATTGGVLVVTAVALRGMLGKPAAPAKQGPA